MKHLRTLFFFVVFWLHQLLILPLRFWYAHQSRLHGAAWVYPRAAWVGRGWGRLVGFLGGARVELINHSDARPDEALLVVSNHQGEFDIPLLIGFAGRPLGFVAKKELAGIPGVSAWMRLMGCIFLDRDDKRKQVAQVRETIDNLKAGQSMVIFPEGTRSGSDEVKAFAKGSLNIARKAGVRIQPVTLSGSWRLKSKGSLALPGGSVRMVLHPVVDPALLSAEEQETLHERIRGQIAGGV